MTWSPIDLMLPQYQNPTDNTPFSGAVLKAYAAGTSTNISMATDATGGTTFTSIALNASGYPEHSGSIVIPHIDQNFKLAFYADQAAADADTPAIWSIDDNIPINITNDFSLEDSVSNAISVVSDFTHTTDGTPVAGIGAGLGLITETASGNNERGTIVGSEFTDVTPGSEDADFVVKLMVAGAAAAEKFRVSSAGVLTVATLTPTNALAVAVGGTGATSAGAALTNLGAQAALSIPSQAEAEAGVATTARSFTAERVKQAIDALGGVGRGYIDGLVISRDTDTDHDTNVTAGVAIDSTNSVTMTLSSEMTKQIDATWVAGDDNGGLASGATLANTTWYHVFLVVVGGNVDVMLDTSVTCANGVANNAVTSFRRINSVLTNGSANIVSYQSYDNGYTQWDVPVADVNTTNPGTSAVTVALSVPTGVSVQSDINFYGSENGAAVTGLVTSLAQTDTTPSATQFDVHENTTGVLGYAVNRPVITNTSAQIRYRFAASTVNLSVIIFTKGWWRI